MAHFYGLATMKSVVSCLLLAAALTQAAVPSPRGFSPPAAPHKLTLKVYFETLCPDSVNFFQDQLLPTWTELEDIINVDVAAYAKANDTATPSGGYSFTCQHGPEECRGNIMMACARKHISVHRDYIDFSLCVMTSEYPPDALEQCAAKQPGVPSADIARCAATKEGEQELHAVGQEQRGDAPGLDYVPWMIVDGEHTADLQERAEKDLFKFTCEEYGGKKPEACGKNL